MASADSGVETGNESNDGSLEAKVDSSLVEHISTVAVSKTYFLSERPITFENSFKRAECILGSDLPQFKLPTTSLPPGFGENYRSNAPNIDEETKSEPRGKMRHCSSGFERLRFEVYKDDIILKLRLAASVNNIELVQSCLHRGANPNSVDKLGRSPLHLASCSGYSDIVGLLLRNGANPNLRDKLGNTPLHLAACTNNIVVITLLLKAGTDVCSSDRFGRSPLQLAQSKLRLLRKHMLSNNNLEVSLPLKQNFECLQEIPIYDNSYIANQALQIVEMMKLYLQKRGQDSEAELLNAFSSRLTLSETKEQVETQVRDLLESLSDLNLDSSSVGQNSSYSSLGGNNIINNPYDSMALISNASSQPAQPCFFMSSTSTPAHELTHTSLSLYPNNQL